MGQFGILIAFQYEFKRVYEILQYLSKLLE